MAKSYKQGKKNIGRLKSQDPEKYPKNDTEQKRKEITALKASKTKYDKYKAKDRMTKRKVHSLSTLSSLQALSSPNNSFLSKQSFGKVKARAARDLPKSPVKKKAVLSSLLSTLSPNSKTCVFNSA